MGNLDALYECDSCNLIYTLERLNVVTGDPQDVLGNHCPNCASENVILRNGDGDG